MLWGAPILKLHYLRPNCLLSCWLPPNPDLTLAEWAPLVQGFAFSAQGFRHNPKAGDDSEGLFLLGSNIVRIVYFALTGMAQWVERHPADQKVNSSSPSQDTCLGCGPGPQ